MFDWVKFSKTDAVIMIVLGIAALYGVGKFVISFVYFLIHHIRFV